MARIVLNTFGSFGDLHPYLAIALGLKERGHRPVIATSEIYRTKVEEEGIEFQPVRPDAGELLDQPEFVRKLWDPKQGSKYLIRDYLAPQVKQAFHDLKPIAESADLLLTHAAGYAGPIVGEVLHMPWLSVALQPAILFSAADPSVVAPAPWLRHLYRLGPIVFKSMMKLAQREAGRWARPIIELRKSLGLPNGGKNPIMMGLFSPYGTLALFSRAFAAPQPDWPTNSIQTGFVFYDKLGSIAERPAHRNEEQHSAELAAFLSEGEPPVLFTLGSSAVMEAGSFYAESLAAIESLGIRAVLLVGPSNRRLLPERLPRSVLAAEYAPYSIIMPRAAAIVHQGGIGTTAQALRAGRPMLVVPWAHDQPDNAERLRKLGVARTTSRRSYNRNTAARELKLLVGNPGYGKRAADAAQAIAGEDGQSRACNAIEMILRRS